MKPNWTIPKTALVDLSAIKKKAPFRLEEPMHPVQIQAWRAMTAEQKLLRLAAMRDAAVEFTKIELRARHPDWTDGRLQEEARWQVMYART